MTMKSVIMTLS